VLSSFSSKSKSKTEYSKIFSRTKSFRNWHQKIEDRKKQYVKISTNNEHGLEKVNMDPKKEK
jgi:hypothetical protein